MKLSLIIFLCFLLFFPLIQAWLYFVQMADWNPAIQKSMYLLTKTIMLAVPVIYTLGVAKEQLRLYPFSKRGMIEGNCFGLGVLAAVCFLYFFWLKPLGVIGPNTPVADAIAERVKAFGLLSSVKFVLFGVFVSLIHSALEEYYWRWFTFR
jgi:hypothetical protein